MTAATVAMHKIVIVAGQEFSVAATTDNQAIREHLRQNFPDVASAEIKVGKRTVDGREVQTVEFVKKAGTKGLQSTDLAALLGTLPLITVASVRRPRSLLACIADRQLTYGEATERDTIIQLVDALRDAAELGPTVSRAASSTKETRLCLAIDHLPAVAIGLLDC